MTEYPKDSPTIDDGFLRWIVVFLNRCEWPGGCGQVNRSWWPLDAAHIRARGMGGGRRNDHDIAVLCRAHHRQFDSVMGQSRKNQEWLRAGVEQRRTPEERRMIEVRAQKKVLDEDEIETQNKEERKEEAVILKVPEQKRHEAMHLLIYLSGYTPSEVARALNLSTSTLSNGLSGRYDLSDEAVTRLADFLGVLPKRLLNLERSERERGKDK